MSAARLTASVPVAARMAPIRRDVSAAKVSEVPKLIAARSPRRTPSFTPCG